MIINQDVNARVKDYTHTSSEALVTGMFPTLQGEGPLAGMFAIFLRLAGCNLGAKHSCEWCDTDFKLKEGKVRRICDLLTEAEDLALGKRKILVLTGGEPLMQNPYRLIDYFLNHGWLVQIETNGYFWSDEMQDLIDRHKDWLLVVLSPKVNQRLEYPVIQPRLLKASSCLKILVDADEKSPYHRVPNFAFDYLSRGSTNPVYVSPINHYRRAPFSKDEAVGFWDTLGSPLDFQRCKLNHRYAAALAMKYGFLLSLQTHLFAEIP